MKGTITLTFTLTFIFALNLIAQNNYYYHSPKGKESIQLSTQKILVKFVEGTSFENQSLILNTQKNLFPLTSKMQLPAPKVVLAELQHSPTEAQVWETLHNLNQNSQVVYANPVFVYADGTLQAVQEHIIVRLKTATDETILKSMAKSYHLDILKKNEFDAQIYHLATNKNTGDYALNIANEWYETGVFDYVEPDFLRFMKKMTTNDPAIDDQWSLNNTGQYNGIIEADMRIFDAWMHQTGNSSVKVAILDEGVDINHPDLLANLEAGYDATGQGSAGAPSGNDAHGTACAGIVGAVGNNGRGMAGVAYNSRIIPVRIAYSSADEWVTSNTWVGNAINWSWQTAGADILSNSWGGGGSSFTIDAAINNAVTHGRNGLGSPVLFAAGNDNAAVSYPATNENTIAVGAISMCNERKNPSSCDGETWWGSNFGEGIDVAAPGVKIYATDISGSAGYSGGDYVSGFNGTSSATPNAAGVMALILSADESLSEEQARFALESTCEKVGNYNYTIGRSNQPNGTWSNELGYGRVNAMAAISSIMPSSFDDAGIMMIETPNDEALCATSIQPVIRLRNNGANNLNTVKINYQVNNGITHTYDWAGNLSTTQNTQVTLPSIPVNDGVHILNVFTSNPNGQTDSNTTNDSAAATFSAGSNELTLRITLDNYGTETTWQVKDANGNILQEGGPYEDNSVSSEVIEYICLPTGCFDFIMYDAYGDGMCCGYGNGSFRLIEDMTNDVLASGGQYGSQDLTNFCVESVQQAEALVVTMIETNDVLCYGDATGSAAAIAQGGVLPCTYTWSNGATGELVEGISAGDYTLKVVDAAGQTVTQTVTIAQPDALDLTLVQSPAMDGNNGYAAVEVTGGTSPYQYVWSNGASTPGISGLGAGTYTVTITDTNECSKVGSVEIQEINTPTLTVDITSFTDVSCHGGQDGTATALATGGFPPYTYIWNNGQNGDIATGFAAGYARVVVLDTQGNQVSVEETISEPTALETSISSVTAVNGNNGSINLTVSGGTPPYTYSWSNGASTEDVNNLAGGQYRVIIEDANGCETAATAVIEEINTPTLTITITSFTNVSCHGGQDGTATALATGGFPPYTYIWNNGQNGETATGFAAGYARIVVLDSEGNQAVVQEAINEPEALTLTPNTIDVTNVNNGSINLTVSGGTAPYTYQWSNGATSANLNDIEAGTYTVTVSDANACTQMATAIIEDLTPEEENALKFEHGLLTDISENWETISLENEYTSMVVIASVRMPNAASQSVVTRVRNAVGSSFEIKAQIAGGRTTDLYEIDYMVIEEGVYNEEEHGVKMEAVRANAAKTARAGSWKRETRTYQNQYNHPVVLGQVMTANNDAWSVFWASSSTSRSKAPTANSFAAGKNVAEDTDRNRTDETIGYLVVEAGHGNINGLNFQAGLSNDKIKGITNTNGQGLAYEIDGLVGATVAVVSTAGMDGNNGGWPALLNHEPVNYSHINLTFCEDQIKDNERSHTTEQAAFMVFEDIEAQPEPVQEIVFEQGIIEDISGQWTTIELENTYQSMVVVTTVVQTSTNDESVVTRIQNANGNSFQLKVQAPSQSGSLHTTYSIHYMVVEEGVYTMEEHGVNMEALKVNSTQTSARNIWKYEYQDYQNEYDAPVILGQVMSYNDSDWSVFWSSNGYRKNPATATSLAIGKHVGEDTDRTRRQEILGYIVMEEGVGHINGMEFIAGLGADIVMGIGGNNGTNIRYDIDGAELGHTAVLSAAGMDGSDCGWPVLYGENPIRNGQLALAFDEDQMKDSERAHTTEQVAFVVFNATDSNGSFAANHLEQFGTNDTPTTYLNLYPNPTVDVINVQHEFTASGNAHIMISDMMGRTVMQEKIFIEKEAVRTIQMDVRHLEVGHYIISIMSDDEPTTQQFIKTK